MTREKAIEKLLHTVKKDVLAKIVIKLAKTQPFNYNLQLLNTILKTSADPKQNWFTSLAVLCIYQRYFAGEILGRGAIDSGNPPLTLLTKAGLIDAIASGSKLTKADAGRALD